MTDEIWGIWSCLLLLQEWTEGATWFSVARGNIFSLSSSSSWLTGKQLLSFLLSRKPAAPHPRPAYETDGTLPWGRKHESGSFLLPLVSPSAQHTFSLPSLCLFVHFFPSDGGRCKSSVRRENLLFEEKIFQQRIHWRQVSKISTFFGRGGNFPFVHLIQRVYDHNYHDHP